MFDNEHKLYGQHIICVFILILFDTVNPNKVSIYINSLFFYFFIHQN
jgi:hypothetical protein